jgi:hypothetical protein
MGPNAREITAARSRGSNLGLEMAAPEHIESHIHRCFSGRIIPVILQKS